MMWMRRSPVWPAALWLACAAAVCLPARGQGADDETARLVAGLDLPPVAATREVIAALPQVQAARAGVDLAQARSRQLAAGAYEWTLKAGAQQRTETAGPVYAEQELALERAIRWGDKARADRAVGGAGLEAGRSAYADAWHEAVRGLLKAWFDWQRERSAAAVQAQQAALAQELLQVARRRVRAGEAPRMDELMAQAEADRAQAAEQQASGRERVQRQELEKRFPGLALAPPSPAPIAPTALPDTPQQWLQRIVAENHEIELAEAEARVAQLLSERARLDTRPDPLLGLRAARERGGQENLLGLYVTVPLPGAYRDAQQGVAQAQADAAVQRLALTRQRVEAAAQRVVVQAEQTLAVWRRLTPVRQAMGEVARLSARAYSLGEVTLTESLQSRRSALEADLAAETARWDAQEAVSRLLVDAHRLWAADAHE